MTTRRHALRYILYTVEVLVFFVVQETPFMLPRITEVKPLLILPVAISIAMLETGKLALIFGVISGLLMDIGYGSIIGPNVIILTSLCFAVEYVCRNYIPENIVSAITLMAVCVVAVVAADFVVNFALKGIDGKPDIFFRYYCPIMLYTVVISPIVYYINKAIRALGNIPQKRNYIVPDKY